MRTIKIIFLGVFILLSSVACASSPVSVKLTVIDENNEPVEDAQVYLGFLLPHGSNNFQGVTDKDGVVKATRLGTFGVGVTVTKEGYYKTGLRTGYGDQDLTLLLREKKNPIAMYAKKASLKAPPTLESDGKNKAYDVWIGYDFEKGDYVAPYGQGLTADFEFKSNFSKKDFWTFSYELEIRFPNPGDGLVTFFKHNDFSVFKSDYVAPISGYQLNRSIYKHAKRDVPLDTNMDKNINYYFRARAKLNENGNVESAHYGKLYGEFGKLHYYFNPTPNDRNVEFGKNLFKNLKHEEQAREP